MVVTGIYCVVPFYELITLKLRKNKKPEKKFMKSGKEYIIFALDVESIKDAAYFIETLSNHVAMFKVGLELFVRSGPDILKMIRKQSKAGIFLDLKLHDIPATVERTMKVISDLRVNLTTVHCGESERMLKAAVSGSSGRVGVLGVTVLTNVSENDILTSGFRSEYVQDMQNLVMKRAGMAKDAGCIGVVCSGLEVAEIKKRFGTQFLAITPGIRPSWEYNQKDDQKRIMTPSMAVQNGADFLVIGRPVRDAHNPVEAVKKIADEIVTLK
jgi:orotidine-5'-phosphate decarboxylase